MWILLYWCYYPHRTRHLVSPVCGIFRCMSHLLKCLCNSVIQSVPHHFLKPESPKFRKKTLTAWQHCCSEIWETWQILQQKKISKVHAVPKYENLWNFQQTINYFQKTSKNFQETSRKLTETVHELPDNFQFFLV